MFGLLMFVGVLSSAFYLFIRQRYSYWQRYNIPSVKSTFPFGSVFLPKQGANLSQQFSNIYLDNKHKGPIIGLYSFLHPMPMLIDVDLIRLVLIKDFKSFNSRGQYHNDDCDVLSANLATRDYDKWKPLRSLISPMFTSSKLKPMFPTICAVGNQLVDYLSDVAATENEVEIRDILARYITDVMAVCAFGIECNSLKDPNTQLRKVNKRRFEEKPNLDLFQTFLAMTYPNLARFLGVRENNDDVVNFFTSIVQKTVEHRETKKIHSVDFMGSLIQLKNAGNLTMNEITANLFTFFTGGFETSTLTLTYCLYELALDKNAHIQERARKEIESVLTKHNNNLTYEALGEMVYCKRIINETWRKYPIITALARIANESCDVPNTKFTIPKGMTVMFSILGIHHDPTYYPNPEEFVPDRFSPEEIEKRPACSFLPFGDGPRNCTGQRFATLIVRIALVAVLRNFKFSQCDRTKIPLEFCTKKQLLTPIGGVWLKVSRFVNK